MTVLGAGALGTLLAGLLSEKNDVSVLARRSAADVINRWGVRVVGATERAARVRAFASADGIEPPELLVVAVKAYDTEGALRSAEGLVGPETSVLSLQNGITTIEVLRGLVPEGSLVAGWTSHGATLERPGVARHAGAGDTVVGELDGRRTARVQAIARAFSSSGMEARVSGEISRELWLKGIVNSAINPLTALARCENGRVAESPDLRRVAKAVCGEGAAVARAEGLRISAAEAFRRTMTVAGQTASNRSSMLMDIELGRRTEVDYLNGAIEALAARHGVAAPVNSALAAAVRAVEGRPGRAGMARGK